MKQKHWQFVRSNPRLTCSERVKQKVLLGEMSALHEKPWKNSEKVSTVFIFCQVQEGAEFLVHEWESATLYHLHIPALERNDHVYSPVSLKSQVKKKKVSPYSTSKYLKFRFNLILRILQVFQIHSYPPFPFLRYCTIHPPFHYLNPFTILSGVKWFSNSPPPTWTP